MKKLVTILALTALVIGGMFSTASAWDDNDHVYTASNGIGDALIFPLYFAAGTFKTNLRVVNTSPTHSVVAKVVFREGLSSCETRDFLIFLTPNDVWTADIVEKNGKTTIVSNDDSSPQVPLEIAMSPSCNGYPDQLGYVEVYEAFAFDNFGTSCPLSAASVATTRPLSKDLLKAAYEAANALNPGYCGNATAADTADANVTFTVNNTNYCARQWRSINVISGVSEVKADGLVLPINATALANNCNPSKLTVTLETRWDSYGRNSAYEVRAAMAKKDIVLPFRNAGDSTFAVLNWPIKLSCCISGRDECDGSISQCGSTGTGADTCLTYDSSIADGDCLHREEFATSWAWNGYDMEENTNIPDDPIFSPVPPSGKRPPIDTEVSILDMTAFQGWDLTFGYDAGWVRLTMSDAFVQRWGLNKAQSNNVYYAGSAVIAHYLQVASDMSVVPAAFDWDAVVTNAASNGSGTAWPAGWYQNNPRANR